MEAEGISSDIFLGGIAGYCVSELNCDLLLENALNVGSVTIEKMPVDANDAMGGIVGPRLFYYMQVEGIFVPSSDTEKGAAVHRRVDKPSAALEKVDESEADPDRPRIVRSLALTSESLGLTATLDLAEISGQVAVPVEYFYNFRIDDNAI